jgi:hypothetical protein
LFLQPIDRAFDLDDRLCDQGIISLASDGIGFSQHFLADEIELSARVVASAAGLFEGFEMMRQTLNLFGDIRALGEDGDFFQQVGFVDVSSALLISTFTRCASFL